MDGFFFLEKMIPRITVNDERTNELLSAFSPKAREKESDLALAAISGSDHPSSSSSFTCFFGPYYFQFQFSGKRKPAPQKVQLGLDRSEQKQTNFALPSPTFFSTHFHMQSEREIKVQVQVKESEAIFIYLTLKISHEKPKASVKGKPNTKQKLNIFFLKIDCQQCCYSV